MSIHVSIRPTAVNRPIRCSTWIVTVGPARTDFELDAGALVVTVTFQIICLDESDVMFNRGFKNSSTRVPSPSKTSSRSSLPRMPDNVMDFAKKFMKDPVHIRIEGDEVIRKMI
ncbi:hypothetical protein L218DRAFT_1009433 [Marasmius fiardii PR-910]|nr:hypothetical protein L218DRAFT_1009433 [Marasmius fiardii PR-910]